MQRLIPVLLTLLALAAPWRDAAAFCGFYVARAEARLFNEASKVVLVRDGDRTVITMASDYRGEPRDFAMVVPVPTFLEREQIHVGNRAVIDHLDAFTAPRLVEYHDADPCRRRVEYELRESMDRVLAPRSAARSRADALGVEIEASYLVGEYDIVILSAKQSDGLETWLRESGYRIPDGASEVLGSYIRQGMRFFVARVNLDEQQRLGHQYLRPLQVAYESPKFMLPIRLGTVNADGPQELFVFALTRTGRVETTNYRTVRLPSGSELPLFVRDDFGDFYRAMFAHQVERERGSAVFLEYAWDMSWCDPCAAAPLTRDELRQLGVFWLGEPRPGTPVPMRAPGPQPVDAFVTRLHVRYDAKRFPEDLVFQATSDRTNFQGRYVLRHPWTGEATCSEAARYREQLRERQETEATTLARLTGWEIGDIRARIPELPVRPAGGEPGSEQWWRRIWGALP